MCSENNLNGVKEKKKIAVPSSSLKLPRRSAKWPRLTTAVIVGELLCRCIWLAWQTQRQFPPSCVTRDGDSCDLLGFGTLCGLLLEMVLSMLFVMVNARWEDQGHLITCWQVVSSAMIWATRRSLFAHPILMFNAVAALMGTYFIGIMMEFTAQSPERLPPFPSKNCDFDRPQYGWLGSVMARFVRPRWLRFLVSFLVFLTWNTRIIIIVYVLFVSSDDLPEFYGGHSIKSDGPHVTHLFYVAMFCSVALFIPELIAELACFPQFWNDWRTMKHSARAYKTGPFEVCTLEDDAKEDSELNVRLRAHQCRSITVVIPAYMPNEEEIVLDVLDYYRVQQAEYPGEMRVLLVWNSPQEHPEIEAELRYLQTDWPALEVRRNTWSTSKCDNLNMAIDLLETEMALLNDMDTMVSAASMCRASLHIFEEGYDIAQSVNTHCHMDYSGSTESGSFCYGALVTAFDASKPLNQSSQGLWGHSPFNGRGGVWRCSALVAVGFDHRSIGEDHDAAYRAFAYFGFRGILDPNMLCQEREPPSCTALTSQRIRWETAGLEMRRVVPWMIRSEHYSPMEIFVFLWSHLIWGGTNMPFQSLPYQLCQLLPFGMVKNYFLLHVLGGKHDTIASMWHRCIGQDCLAVFNVTWPWGQKEVTALPMAVVMMGVLLGIIVLTCLVDHMFRFATTRYRPLLPWACFSMVFKHFTVMPYIFYLQFRALHDFMWGSAKFIVTPRSSFHSGRKSLLESSEAMETRPDEGSSPTHCKLCPRALGSFTRPLISIHAKLSSSPLVKPCDGPEAPLLESGSGLVEVIPF